MLIRNLHGMSALNTPDSIASTWPPTYVSESWEGRKGIQFIKATMFFPLATKWYRKSH